MCARLDPLADFKQTELVGQCFLLVQPWSARARALVKCPGNPNPVETVESDSRVRSTFGLGVDSPEANHICALLVRGTMAF